MYANVGSVYADSSKDPFDDPKVETIVEIFKRIAVSVPDMRLQVGTNKFRAVLGVLSLLLTSPTPLPLLSLATLASEASTALSSTRP